MCDAAMRAEAVAEKGGKIIAVGSKDDVMALKGSDTKMIDLAGRTMLPGFFDAHGHVFLGGLQGLSANLLAPPDGKVTDIASLQQTLRDWMTANAETIKKANLIIGFGYDNATLAEHRHPTCDDLDKIRPRYRSISCISRGISGRRTPRRWRSRGSQLKRQTPLAE